MLIFHEGDIIRIPLGDTSSVTSGAVTGFITRPAYSAKLADGRIVEVPADRVEPADLADMVAYWRSRALIAERTHPAPADTETP